jgi:biopolymer transport protein ExbD
MRRRKSSWADEEGEAPAETRTRAGSEADLDITPMIDVTFLLLIFFMVTSTMRPARELDLPPAVYGTGVPDESAAVIVIKLSEGQNPVLELGEAPGTPAVLEDVRAYVEAQADEGRTEVVIKADRDVPHGFVQKVAREIASVDGVEFSYAVRDRQPD